MDYQASAVKLTAGQTKARGLTEGLCQRGVGWEELRKVRKGIRPVLPSAGTSV